MTFYVGQKVVCINDEPPRNPAVAHIKIGQEGQVYTVRGLLEGAGKLYLYLEEIINPVVSLPSKVGWFHGEPPLLSNCFRPAVDTNIDIFTAMLTPTREGVPA
jgi:hypothetical protein